MLDQNIFEGQEEIEKIVKQYPDYFDLDFYLRLPKLFNDFQFKINNTWYKLFSIKLQKKIQFLRNYKSNLKILILIGAKGQYAEAFLFFLSYLDKDVGIISFVEDQNFKQAFNLLAKINKNIKIKILEGSNKIDYNYYDFIISLCPNFLLVDLLRQNNLKSRLIFIDFGLDHGIEKTILIDKSKLYLKNKVKQQTNKLDVYSCQKEKYHDDYDHFFNSKNIKIKYFQYIPIYFKYFPSIKTKKFIFDIIILGTNCRQLEILVKYRSFLRDKRILFLGGNKYVKEITELKKNLNIKVLPRGKHEYYIKLLALSKIVFFPLRSDTNNVLISVSDALAMGKAIVTSACPGISQITDSQDANNALIAINNENTDKFVKEIDKLLTDEEFRLEYENKAIAYARKELNIDLIFYKIFKDILKNIN